MSIEMYDRPRPCVALINMVKYDLYIFTCKWNGCKDVNAFGLVKVGISVNGMSNVCMNIMLCYLSIYQSSALPEIHITMLSRGIHCLARMLKNVDL